MNVDKKLISYNGIELTDDLLDQMAREYENGTWSGHDGAIHAGRPRFGEEKLIAVTFKIAPSILEEIDKRAKQHGVSRSQELRDAVDRDINRDEI